MFEFGIIGTLDPQMSMVSFFGVIIFILGFEFLTGLLEYCLEESPLYQKMVQTIYKELMQMGIASLIIVLYEASSESASHEWIQSIDVAHIVLFFVAIFLVTHAFFLMAMSIFSGKEFLILHNKSIVSVMADLRNSNWFSHLLYKYSPFSSQREQVEFKILYLLFRDTYYQLPEDFEFSIYLTRCFQKYAMRTTEVSIYSWGVVVVVLAANFLRAQFNGPLSCADSAVQSASGSHRALGSTPVYNYDDHVGDDHAATDDHGSLYVSDECSVRYVYLFCSCAVVVVLYCFILVLISRVFVLRLMRRVGITGIHQYQSFLQFCVEDEQATYKINAARSAAGLPEKSLRLNVEELKTVIESSLDAREHKNEDSMFYFKLVTSLQKGWERVDYFVHSCVVSIKLFLSKSLTDEQLQRLSHGGSILAPIEVVESTPEPEIHHNRNNSLISTLKHGMERGSSTIKKSGSFLNNLTSKGPDAGAGAGAGPAGSPSTEMRKGFLPLSLEHNLQHLQQKARAVLPSHMPTLADMSGGRGRAVSNDSSEDGSEVSAGKKSEKGKKAGIQWSLHTGAGHEPEHKFDSHTMVSTISTTNHRRRSVAPVGIFEDPTHSPAMKRTARPSFMSAVNKTKDTMTEEERHCSSKISNEGNDITNLVIQDVQQHAEIVVKLRNRKSILASGTVKVIAEEPKQQQQQQQHEPVVESNDHNTTTVSRYIASVSVPTPGAPTEAATATWGSRLWRHCCSSSAVQPTSVLTDEGHLSDNFDDIFFLNSRMLFFRAVEVAIMLNSLYMGFWATNFISIVIDSTRSKTLLNIYMAVPIVLCFICIGSLAKVCAIMDGVANVDHHLETIKEVAEECADMNILLEELRNKILSRISHMPHPHVALSEIFYAVDEDRSGTIDKIEFRDMLRRLNLCYSDSRFKRMFRAVDINGDATISLEDFGLIVFPNLRKFEDVLLKEQEASRQIAASNVSRFDEADEDEDEDGDKDDVRSTAPVSGKDSVC